MTAIRFSVADVRLALDFAARRSDGSPALETVALHAHDGRWHLIATDRFRAIAIEGSMADEDATFFIPRSALGAPLGKAAGWVEFCPAGLDSGAVVGANGREAAYSCDAHPPLTVPPVVIDHVRDRKSSLTIGAARIRDAIPASARESGALAVFTPTRSGWAVVTELQARSLHADADPAADPYVGASLAPSRLGALLRDGWNIHLPTFGTGSIRATAAGGRIRACVMPVRLDEHATRVAAFAASL